MKTAAVLATLAALAIGAQAQPLYLVQNGVCNVSIHNVSASPTSSVECYAAAQLQAAFSNATGLIPAVNPVAPAAIQIKIGLVSQFSPDVGSAASQAYCYRRAGGNIELVGNTNAGVLWAVDAFSRDILQVTWPCADDLVTRVGPAQTNVVIDELNVIGQPDFVYRGWIVCYNGDSIFLYSNLVGNWMSHTRQNIVQLPYAQLNYGGAGAYAMAIKRERGIESDTTTHSFYYLVPTNLYDSHPEYFPLIGGVRVQPTVWSSTYLQLCLSNTNILNIVTNAAIQTFHDYPDVNVFGVCQNDGFGGWCECTNCTAWDGDQLGTGRFSNRLIHFVNLVAEKVANVCPGKYIGTLAYDQTFDCPTIAVNSNVAITFGTGGHIDALPRNYMTKLTDPADPDNASLMLQLTNWLAKTPDVHFYEYYYYTGSDRCPVPWSRTLCNEFHELYNLGLKGIVSETTTNWTGMSFFGYTFSRLSWDTTLTYDTIMSDFCDERYGPAAGSMEAYHRLYEDTIYARISKMYCLSGVATQLIPNAFSKAQITSMDTYLATAATQVNASGTSYNKTAATNERAIFDGLKQMFDESQRWRTDPETLPGIGTNLVPDPGAEYGGSGWGFHAIGGAWAYSVTNVCNHSGNWSFYIHCIAPGTIARWYRDVYGLTAGKKYAYRAWVNTANGGAGNIMITGDNILIRTYYADTLGQWVMVVCPEFTATSDTIRIYLQNESAGDVYFDDVFVAELPDPADPQTWPGIGPNLVTDPGAEGGGINWGFDVQGGGEWTNDVPIGGAHSGDRSLFMGWLSGSGYARWYQPSIGGFTVGKKYAARMWVNAGDGVNGQIWVYPAIGGSYISLDFTNTQSQWAMLVNTGFTAVCDTYGIYMNNVYGSGDIYFDDIFIAECPGQQNYEPVANALRVTTAEDTATAATLTGADLDGDTLTFAIIASPAHGTLTGATPNLTYTPNTDWNGTDTFTFQANDGKTNSNTATVTITVTSVNDAPTVSLTSPVNNAVLITNAVTIAATAADIDGTVTQVAVYANGNLLGTNAIAPYNYTWANVTGGAYTLTARAYDNGGATTLSVPVSNVIVWNTKDIGTSGGSASYSAPTYTVAGKGAGITGANDAFRFVYQPVTGNCTIIARVTSFNSANTAGRAGVMIRESTNANAKEVSSLVAPYLYSPDREYLHQRTTTGGSTTASSYLTQNINCWVKVVRNGTTFSTWRAPDSSGVPGTWSKIGSDVTGLTMTDPVQVGLAVTSGNTVTKTAKFDNVNVTTP